MTIGPKFRILIFSSACSLVLFLPGCGPSVLTSVHSMPDQPLVTTVDHSKLSEVIGRVLIGNHISPTNIAHDTLLTNYLQSIALQRMDVFVSRQAELAFWINAHNAYLLDMLRLNRVKDAAALLHSDVALIGAKFFSLDDIEHTIIPKNFREPRAFFALFTGAKSGPVLFHEAYTEQSLSDQLDKNLHDFLADSTKNRVDARSNTLYLSEVFNQYKDEIENSAGSMLQFVRAFALPTMGEYIDAHPALHIVYLPYNSTIM